MKCPTIVEDSFHLVIYVPIRLVLAHMQLVMSSVSHVQQKYKHEVQQPNSRFASGLNTSDIMSRQKTEWVQDFILNMTNMRKGLKDQTRRDEQLWQNHCSQEKLSFPNWVPSPNWANCPTPYMPMPFIFLLAYAMLTSINENNANADIAFTWLALN